MTLTDFADYLGVDPDSPGFSDTGMLAELLGTVEAMVDVGAPIRESIINAVDEMTSTLSKIQFWATFSRDK